jgi:hypothetical protein
MRKWIFFSSLVLSRIVLPSADADPGANGANLNAAANTGEPVVARGKGFEIRHSEMDQVLATAKAASPGEPLPPDAPLHVISQLIEIKLVLLQATDSEKAEGKKGGPERRPAFENAGRD